MQRTNIYLEERQTAALDAAAGREGITRAELVRRLVDRGLEDLTGGLQADLEVIDASFGVLASDEAEPLQRGRSAREDHLQQVWDG